jgi:hypothetical protein
MKKKGNKMVPNCVPKEDKDADKKIKKEKKWVVINTTMVYMR